MKRTPDINVDREFSVDVPITKSYVDTATGQRHIVGVASGVAEDRDGERVSKNAIAGMARAAEHGGVKLTSAHQQDWMTEIGDVVKAEHDPETDELIVDTVLPPEGHDAIADKAWKVANTQQVGFSVGGKLLKSFFEKNELGKKRKVLDSILLRHVMLTKSPSYPHSFAEGVAKTFTGDAPADAEFTLDVEKDLSTGSQLGNNGGSGNDSKGSGPRNAGQRDPEQKGMRTDEDGSDEDKTADLPQGKDQERHLACPNCGHEFAADLPVDADEQQPDEDEDQDTDHDEDKPTGKSLTEKETPTVSKLTETLDSLKALADADAVSKTETDTEDVTKQATGEDLEVAKLVAASHRAHEDRFTELEASIGQGFEMIAKAYKGLIDRLDDAPQGRKSVARVLPPATGHADGGDVEKSTEQLVDEAPDALSALKALNAARGIR